MSARTWRLARLRQQQDALAVLTEQPTVDRDAEAAENKALGILPPSTFHAHPTNDAA